VLVVGAGGLVVSAPIAGATTLPATVHRISGATRLATAIAASQDQFTTAGSAKAVVLTRADTYPDALAGVPLAARVGGPLLLTASNSLDPTVRAEIVRVLPAGATVYILGGTAAVSTAVQTTITGLGFTVQRIAGSDRFATAVAVANALGQPATIFEATGLNFPDALAGGPAAINVGGAILLTNGSVQAPATAAYLAAHTSGARYALGGPAALADPAAIAIAGTDRYATAARVAATFFATPTSVGVATGTNFPDALAAGPDLASKDAPLLLVPPTGTLPAGTAAELLRFSGTLRTAFVFGGAASVSDDVAAAAGQLANLGATAAAQSASAAFAGRYGVLGTHVQTAAGSANTTQVFDGTAGTSTFYTEHAGAKTISGTPTRADFAAFPTNDSGALETAVNTAFASVYAQEGYSSTDPHAQFLVNAEQVVINPLASATLRLAVFIALTELPNTIVQSAAHDTGGHTGIGISGPVTGNTALNGDSIGYIFDPATGFLLEDNIVTPRGTPIASSSVTTFTTLASAPPDPYPS
jgi:putative cell wall-binding protein